MTRSRDECARVRFGDVVENINDQPQRSTLPSETRYIAGEHVDEDRLTIARWGTLGDDLVPPTFRRRFQSGDVLFHSRNLRKIAVPEFGGITGEKLFVLRSHSPSLLQEFIPFLLLSPGFTACVQASWSGSVNKFLNWTPLERFEFDLPSIRDQLSIVEGLSALHAVIEAYRCATHRAMQTRDSLIMHLYQFGTGSEERVVTPLGVLPKSWTVEPLDSRYDVQLGKKLSPAAAAKGDRRPYLRNENIDWNTLDLSDIKEMGFTADERSKVELRPGDIVACEGRHVGKSAIWRGEVPGMCCQNTLHRLRARTEEDSSEYMLHCLRYFHITGRFVVDTAASTIPHLTLDRFRPMLFPFPPAVEQHAISGRIRRFDDITANLTQRLRNAVGMLQHVSASCFS